MKQSIIPGLPDDLALRCIAKLSHGYHGTLECVSKGWRDLVRSEDYSRYKARNGWSGSWLFVLTERFENRWIAYDPDADRWHPLPCNGAVEDGWYHSGFECVCVSSCLLVIGGCYVSSCLLQDPVITRDVMRFDPFKKEWKRAASMRTPRSDFACAIVSGKVYVAGGRSVPIGMSSAEVYDPVADRWEELPAMPKPQIYHYGSGFSYKGFFHVLSEQVMKNDRLYTIVNLEQGGSLIKTRDTNEGEWSNLGSVPCVALPNHPGEQPVSGFGFAALRDELYVVGGHVSITSDGGRFEFVKLSVARVCNPLARPLIWRETKLMCIPAGGHIIGCVSLDESSPP